MSNILDTDRMTPRQSPQAAGVHSPIRARRGELRITQAGLAAMAQISRQTVVAIEQGDYAPSVYLALRIAKALDSTVEQLFIEAADDAADNSEQV